MGVGAEVENLAFVEEGETAILVGAVTSPHLGGAVFARSLLRIDLVQNALVDAIPLPRDGIARGISVDRYRRRAYLLNDDGEGRGEIQVVDLYGGTVKHAQVGDVPRGVRRKGLALDREGRYVFCLVGGESTRSDFAPVDEGETEGPELVVFDGDSLSVVSRIPLHDRFEARAVAYDETLGRVYVLETDREQSLLVIVDPAFSEIRSQVALPEETTDLVLSGGYAFCPGPRGIYVVDLGIESLVGRPAVAFEFTGEIAVAGDLESAFVLYQSASTGRGPGIAHVALRTGEVMDVLQ
jgi:hypothetical protein